MGVIRKLHPRSPVREYISWIRSSGDEETFQRKYQEIMELQYPWGACFLSIIIRTQGKRNDMLQDVLMCLLAQTDQDFEVILLCHRAAEEDLREMQKLLRRQAPALQGKVLVIPTDEGERGAPVNLGFAYARGAYAVCLDDDDLVMDNWVECFHQAALQHRGMILRSWAVLQPWRSMKERTGTRERITAAGTPDAKYCIPYHTLHEQAENMCPFMTLAFPLFLFREMHILLKEDLTTTEDWDYILRTAGIAGIYDIQEVTSIYRLWDTEGASRNLIREEEWSRNYRKISGEHREDPLLLPREEVFLYRDELNALKSSGEKGRSCFFQEAILFWSAGEEGFSDERYTTARIQMTEDEITAAFTLDEGLLAQRIRVDPAPESLFTLADVEAAVLFQGQIKRRFTLENIWETNGIVEGNQALFLTERPMMVFDAGEQMEFDEVLFRARVSYRGLPSIEKWAMAVSADERWLSENRKKAHLYWDRGDGFTTEQSMEYSPSITKGCLMVDFDLAGRNLEGTELIRLDPTEAGMIWLDHLRVTIIYEDGTEETLAAGERMDCNGFFTADGAAFLARDPYLTLRVSRTPARVKAEAEARELKTAEAENLLAEAARVPNYEEIIRQLNQARGEQWMEGSTEDEQQGS